LRKQGRLEMTTNYPRLTIAFVIALAIFAESIVEFLL
jgi:hypothetical protein